MIYKAEDKSNDRLDRRCMHCFRAFLNNVELEELHLLGSALPGPARGVILLSNAWIVCLPRSSGLRSTQIMCCGHSPRTALITAPFCYL